MSLPSKIDVAIIGAGAAGLGAAHALKGCGLSFIVLEARDRVGGRNWSIRRGTRLDMNDGTRQLCEFDPEMYWNSGPARIPSAHQAVLGYCRELGVALEVEINVLKGKQLTNIRTTSKDEAVRLTPPIRMTLEKALAYIEDDELVEVTPKSIRLRKKFLDPNDRKRAEKAKQAVA